MAELSEPLGADALQKRCEQPAAHVPGEAERPGQDRRARVEASVDVHLLAHGRPVPRVLRGGLGSCRLHGSEDLTGESPATGGVECERGRRGSDGVSEITFERRRT